MQMQAIRTARAVRSGGLAVTVVALLLATLAVSPSLAQSGGARVAAVSGEVVLVRDGRHAAAGPGTALRDEDRLMTGEAARVELEYADGSRLVLGGGSILVLRHYAEQEDGGREGLLELLRGILRMALRPGPDTAVEITTRTAIASVRSTEWVVEAGAGKTAVFVVNGSVEVTARQGGGRVLLQPGQGTDVGATGAPTAAKLWGAARVRDVMERTAGL